MALSSAMLAVWSVDKDKLNNGLVCVARAGRYSVVILQTIHTAGYCTGPPRKGFAIEPGVRGRPVEVLLAQGVFH